MRRILSAAVALFIPLTASLALAQPNLPPPGPGPKGPDPFRKGLPPAPKLPPKAPLPPPTWFPSIDPNPPQNWGWLPSPYEQLPIQPNIRGGVANLDGTWYMNGDPNKPARIVQWRLDGRAIFINENGSKTWGTVGADTVWIPEWTDRGRPGLVGTIRGDMLIWPDRNFWSRQPVGGWFWDR